MTNEHVYSKLKECVRVESRRKWETEGEEEKLLTEWDRLCVGVNHWRHHRVDAVAIVVVVR